MTRRLRALAAAALVAIVAIAIIVVDARMRRVRAESSAERNRALVRATGLGDLMLSSSARWLRHPSHAEPAAPMQDVPAGLDVDPAGALIGPVR